jgi:hypothetical protein
LPRPWKSMRSCAIIHPLHLELETAGYIDDSGFVNFQRTASK